MSHSITFLIPTRNRREDLTRLLESLAAQTRKADSIIIIDGSDADQTIRDLSERYASLHTCYVRVYPPGLTKQRNAGLQTVSAEATLVGFLDDDLELLPTAVEKMLAFWEKALPEALGASFNILNNDAPRVTALRRLFLISSERGGAVLPSGFNNVLFPVHEDTETEWLCGGATVWRAEIFKTHRFEERYRGYGHFDDLDFCFSLPCPRRFYVLRDSHVYHHAHPFRADRLRVFGASDTINRYLFVKRFNLSFPAYLWATFGQILGTFLSGIVRRDRSRIYLAWGSLEGALQIAFRRAHSTHAIDVK